MLFLVSMGANEVIMNTNRKEFLKYMSMTGIGLAGANLLSGCGSERNEQSGMQESVDDDHLSIIGEYGDWAASLLERELPAFSLRRQEWNSLDNWREAARNRALERMAIPDIGGTPEVRVDASYSYDELDIEELSWQLPYGRRTKAIVLKPEGATGRLPAILAFYDHGLQKFFGVNKITRTSEEQHPVIRAHQQDYYDGYAWANEIAKRGYVVMVPDVFAFGSRKVRLQDVPTHINEGLGYRDPDSPTDEEIAAYNQWTARHEHIMAKSLFSAGTTWPGVFFGEDRISLDVLYAREDVDRDNIGCGGLSGGGIRTVMMGGMDPRIKCAVCISFMTTWKDLVMYKSYTHTWMSFVPLLPNELDFPEILALRAPLPTLVLNAEGDELFTLSEMQRACEIMEEVYQLAGAAEHYTCSFHPGGHKFGTGMQTEAFDWFDRWLKI